jgi:hypothetical protein
MISLGHQIAIRAALEAAGVEFIEQSVGGPGVRLKILLDVGVTTARK